MTITIITGVDGSDTAEVAAAKAAELAQKLDTELHVLSAYGKYAAETFSSGGEKIVFSTVQDAERVVSTTIANLRKNFPGLALSGGPAEGKPGVALIKAAERLNADLIVVGNKRVQGATRFLGSIARDVASQAPCDVYVVNTHQEDGEQ